MATLTAPDAQQRHWIEIRQRFLEANEAFCKSAAKESSHEWGQLQAKFFDTAETFFALRPETVDQAIEQLILYFDGEPSMDIDRCDIERLAALIAEERAVGARAQQNAESVPPDLGDWEMAEQAWRRAHDAVQAHPGDNPDNDAQSEEWDNTVSAETDAIVALCKLEPRTIRQAVLQYELAIMDGLLTGVDKGEIFARIKRLAGVA